MRKRGKDIKEFQLQMSFVRECNENCCEVKGVAVHRPQHGAVNPGWLSACEEEQALTAGIMEEVASLSNLQKAYGQVVKNGGSGGTDGMEMKGFGDWAKDNIPGLQQQLQGGNYKATAVRGVQIPKTQGGCRRSCCC